MSERYLVTPALFYANGAPHLGHMVEAIQVNIFVRALRMAGKEVLNVCGADAHGTPIEVNARKSGMDPASFAKQWQAAFEKTFASYDIEFDGGYGTTHSPENEKHAQTIYQKLQEAGHIVVRDVEQLFDESEQRFLPDRLVRGTCPKCQAKDQYGDSCEVCGNTYRPTELINPVSALSGSKPVLRSSSHYFFTLSKYSERLKNWINTPGILQEEVKKSLALWQEEGLKDWDISRDGPYFGFKIPGEENKYFYVWLDAPVGYISLTDKAAQEKGQSFTDYWLNQNTKIYHFIGKDIVYFHTLFWPAMLLGAGYQLPSAVCVHGMLTVNGEKMSKSRGTFILADTFAQHVDPSLLRFYFASKLTPRIEDIDLNLEEFANRVNSGLINKVINVLSRAIPLLHRFCEGKLGEIDRQGAASLIDKAEQVSRNSFAHYFARDTAQAVREILELADEANKYLQDEAPWKQAKNNPEQARKVLSTGIWAGKVCVALLKPVMPKLCSQLEEMLGIEEVTFATAAAMLPVDHEIKAYEHLLQRVEASSIEAIVIPEKREETSKVSAEVPKVVEQTKMIDFAHFAGVDLRAGLVLSAEELSGSDKMIAVRISLGAYGERNIFTGLRPHVAPAELVGKTVLVVTNLAPRKMRFGVSEGMILACGDNPPRPIFLEGSQPGDKVS